MKNYKINAFDIDKLLSLFNISTSKEVLGASSMEKTVYQILSSDKNIFYMYENIYDKEGFELLVNEEKKYINEFGELFSKEERYTRTYLLEEGREDVNEEGDIIVTKYDVPSYKEIIIDWYNISSGILELTTDVTKQDLPFLSEDDLVIYSNAKIEKIYDFLKVLNVGNIGYSGIITPQREIDSANGALNEFGFSFDIPDKKEFIISSIKLIEEEILSIKKRFTIDKLEELLLNDIYILDEKYGTKGNNICIENKNKTTHFNLLLVLLQLKGKINIKIFQNSANEHFLDIVGYGMKKGIYFNENNGEVFKDGGKLGSINLGTNQFKFFKFLYDNTGVHKTNKEIVEEGIRNKSVDTYNQYITGIKKDLDEPIKNIIEAGSGGYIIRK